MSVNVTSKNNQQISLVLARLIADKSKRDKVDFTASKLADAIDVHRSVITKLLQTDINKRVLNPRIDTLIKIVSFFKNDGFAITLDDLAGLTDD